MRVSLGAQLHKNTDGAIIWTMFREKWTTKTLPNAEARDAGIWICNEHSGFLRAEVHSYSNESDHLLWSLCVRHGSMIYCPRRCNWRIIPSSNGHQRVTWEPVTMMMPGAKLASLLKVKTRHHCNDVKAEPIRTPHTTVSQQEEQVRIVTGQWATQKDEQRRRNIVWNKLCVELERLQLLFRITNESQHQLGDPGYTATEPRWQSTINMIWRSCRWNNEFSTEGESLVKSVRSYWQAKRPPEAVRCDTHPQVYQADHNSTSAKSEIGFRKWTPLTEPSSHSPQMIRANSLYCSTILGSVQWCDCVVATSQNVFSHLS